MSMHIDNKKDGDLFSQKEHIFIKAYWSDKTPWAKASWGVKGLFRLYFNIIVHHWSNSGQEFKQDWILEAGDDAECRERYCFLHGLLSLLSYRTQDLQVRDE